MRTGQDTPKPEYDHLTFNFNFGGPIRIPHLIRNGPQLTLNYGRTYNHNAKTQTFEVPTAAQLAGNFSSLPQLYFPGTQTSGSSGTPIPGNIIPASLISPQAAALLKFFPQANFVSTLPLNYQVALVGETHQDQARVQQVHDDLLLGLMEGRKK